MRIAPVALLFLAAPALAQDPIPDTTDAWRYFPLEVGNVWEYECWCIDDIYRRHSVPADTLVDGARYFLYHIEVFEPTGSLIEEETLVLRFDTLTATIEGIGEGFGFGCPLDADFDAGVKCTGGTFKTYGGPQIVTIGTDTLLSSLKGFMGGAGDVDEQYVADIGYFGSFGLFESAVLLYARVGGTEYGEPFVLASEPGPSPPSLALAVYPNPSYGVAMLALSVPARQAVTVAVFDALGRRFYEEERTVAGQARFTLDGSGWAPGVYVVRATGAEGAQATALLVRR
jgi:hypothetical protein